MLKRINILQTIILLGFLITAAPAVAQNPSESGNLTGNYILDARPSELFYLSLTQSASDVSGYAVIVEPNTDSEASDVLASQTLNVEGIATNTSVTLVIGDSVSGQITMTGSEQGDSLMMTYPTTTGEISTVTFQPTDRHAFNQIVSDWRSDVTFSNMNNPNADLIQELKADIADNPDNVDAILLFANVMSNSGLLSLAIPYYERALDIASDHTSARLDFARALADGGLRLDAEAQFERVLDLQPDNQEAMYYLANLYLAWNPPRTDEAITLMEQLIAVDPNAFIAEQAQTRLTSVKATVATPELDAADDDGEEADTEAGSFDLGDAPLYSDGSISGSPDSRLGFDVNTVTFSDNPDGVSLLRDDVEVQTVSDGDSQILEICADGSCVEATSADDDISVIDDPIGWVDNTLLYQRITEDQEVELRAVEWNGAPVSDEGFGSLDGTVTALGAAYPVGIGTLVPTDSAWLLVEDGSVQVIDGNPYGAIQLVRTDYEEDIITYVAGGQLIIASVSSPGTAISTVPFSGVDYDLSPDASTVAISNGSGIELWSRDGTFIGASDSSIDTGSVVWRSTGIIFIDQTNDLLRLLDPAALQP